MKAKITFLGGIEEGDPNAKSVTWDVGKDKITFKVDEPIEIDTDHPEDGAINKQIMQRAQGNRFFRVELIPSDTPVPEGKKSPVDQQPVTNIDHSKEAMQVDPIRTDEEKAELAKREAAQASREAQRDSKEVAKGHKAK